MSHDPGDLLIEHKLSGGQDFRIYQYQVSLTLGPLGKETGAVLQLREEWHQLTDAEKQRAFCALVTLYYEARVEAARAERDICDDFDHALLDAANKFINGIEEIRDGTDN